MTTKNTNPFTHLVGGQRMDASLKHLKKQLQKHVDQITTPVFITFPNDMYNPSTYSFYSKSFQKNLFQIAKNNANTSHLSPLSGFEPLLNLSHWNNNPRLKSKHNCFAYAFNKVSVKRNSKPQPGYFIRSKNVNNQQYTCKNFYHKMKKENPAMHLTTFDQKCAPGFSKAFFALDSKEDHDYHFYRQDNNKYWSHKPGLTNVTNLDASSKKISNPLTANRKYTYYNYDTPCFFMCVNNDLSRSHSTTK
jgi:hypothetical protein